MTRHAAPVLQHLPRTPKPEEYPGSLTRNEDLDYDRWQASHRRAENFAATPRGKIETAIEQLIALLDQIDGDSDAEDIDEPEPDQEGEASAQPVSLAWAR